ncbi:FtsX-like permease family protein [Paucilactobacillus oligofermentans]|nr:FtsX-like permease family protein [Paucilactobacillus oligofermentans]
MIFGGLTLFFVLGGIISSALKEMQLEYQLWAILGASPRQISRLVGVQLMILGLLSSIIGYFISLITVAPFYYLLQKNLGSDWLPTVPFKFSVLILIITSGIIAVTCFITGFIRTKKCLKQLDESKKTKQKFLNLSNLLTTVCLIGITIIIISILISSPINISAHPSIITNAEIQPLYFTLILLITLQLSSGRGLFPWIIFIMTKYLPTNKTAIGGTAQKQAIANSERITTTIIPLLIVQTLLVGLYELLFGFTSPNQIDIQNVVVSFIVYVGAPLILVIANIISLTMLNGRQQINNLVQLTQLGFTKLDLLKERLSENLIIFAVLLVASVFNSLILFTILALICFKTGVSLNISLLNIITISCVGAIITGIILTIIDWYIILQHHYCID